MAYYSTHGITQFLLNNEKQRVRFLLARPKFKHFSGGTQPFIIPHPNGKVKPLFPTPRPLGGYGASIYVPSAHPPPPVKKILDPQLLSPIKTQSSKSSYFHVMSAYFIVEAVRRPSMQIVYEARRPDADDAADILFTTKCNQQEATTTHAY